MQAHEAGHGNDRVGIGSAAQVADRAQYKTEWRVHRYCSDLHERKVRPLMERAGELLMIAEYHLRAKRFDLVAKYRELAGKIIAEGEAFASDQVLVSGNLLLNEGINAVWTLVVGGTETAYSNANARLGVGDSSAAEAATQTDLQAVTNKTYKAMEAGFPTYGTSQKITFKSVFGSADANYAWNEFTVDNGGTALKNINRKVSAQGTKASGQTWTLTLDITLS